MHVGCAFFGKNEYGEYPAVRRVYYFPGHQDENEKHNKVVANCFCLKHAEDVSALKGCGTTRYPKGSKQAPRLYDHRDEAFKNGTQSLLYMEGASEQMEPPPPLLAAETRRRQSSAQNNTTKPQSSQRRPSHQQPPLQANRRHSQQQQQHSQQPHPKRPSESTTRAKNNVSTASSGSASSLFFSNFEMVAAPAATTHAGTPFDFELLVAELRNATSKIDRTIIKKKWRRGTANMSSDKFNAWWERALKQSKEPPCETATTNTPSASRAENHHDVSNRPQPLPRPPNGGDEEKLKQEMIQAVSDAVALLGEDKKNDLELVRETAHEKRTFFRQQHHSMSKADFNTLWKHVRERVGQMHGIIIRPFKKRNSEQQQGPLKPPPDIANAIAAAAAAAADAAIEPSMKKRGRAIAEAAGETPMKKKKSQEQQQQQVHVETDGSTMATDPKESVGERKATSATSFLAIGAAAASSTNPPTLQPRAESNNNDDVNDHEKQAESSMEEEEEPSAEQRFSTTEQIRFHKMLQSVDDDSATHRHQVPLQVILKTKCQEWEQHYVREGPSHERLSDLEFASLWKRVEQRACENWQRRIQRAAGPMDWNFLVFGKQYDAKKAKTYCSDWDTTMNSDAV
jgi:hypothetical protein